MSQALIFLDCTNIKSLALKSSYPNWPSNFKILGFKKNPTLGHQVLGGMQANVPMPRSLPFWMILEFVCFGPQT